MATATTEPNLVTASITVNFQSTQTGADGGAIRMEVDSRADGLNGGKTTFFPGDPVFILVFRDSNVSLDFVRTTAGTVASSSSGNIDVDEVLTISNSDTAQLSYPPSGTVSFSYLGSGLGNISLHNGRDVQTATVGYALIRAQYKSGYTARRLQSVPVALEQVIVYAQGTVS